jgi:uncharacterized metal-binding protein YceD (DUF177 family)
MMVRMPDRLIIDLQTLPEDGKRFTGELPQEIFDLPAHDAKPVGPLQYDLDVRRFESELLLTGSLSAPFEFTCVRTIHPFIQTISIENAAIAIEIESGSEIDATDALREEVLIEFPAHPLCEEGDVPQTCEIDPRYLAVDKSTSDAVESAPQAEGDDRWTALDRLKNLNNDPT